MRRGGLLALLALLAVALQQQPACADDSLLTESVVYAPTNRGLVPERFMAYGQMHYSQMYQPQAQAKGTIVFFHGCARAARAFWPFNPVLCPECLGFPEHVSHSKQALSNGYNVIVMDPTDTKHLCWSSSNNDDYLNDQPRVMGTLMQLLARRGLLDKPVFLWGASSGGTFALKMVQWLGKYRAWAAQATQAAANDGNNATDGSRILAAYRVDGIISEVASPEDFGAFDAGGKLATPYPPVIFVRMERDNDAADFQANATRFRANGVPSDVITSPVRQVTPQYFSKRAPVITPEQSAAIVDGLQQIGLLDDNGYLTADPAEDETPGTAAYRWEQKLRALLPWLAVDSHSLNLVYRTSLIHQALYVAYAKHEAVSDYFTVCLKWLEAGGRTNLPTLLRQWTVPSGNLTMLTMSQPFAAAPARR